MTYNPDSASNDFVVTTQPIVYGGTLTFSSSAVTNTVVNGSAFKNIFSYGSQSGVFTATNIICPDWLNGYYLGTTLSFSNNNLLYFTNTSARGFWTNGFAYNPPFSSATTFAGTSNNVIFTNNLAQSVSFSNTAPISISSINFMPSNLASCLVTAFIDNAYDVWVTNGLTIGALGSGLNSTSTLYLFSGEMDVTNNGLGIVTVGQSLLNRATLTIAAGATLMCDQLYITNSFFGTNAITGMGGYSNSMLGSISGTLQINNGSHITMWATSGYSSAASPLTINAGGKLIYAGGTNVIDEPPGSPVGIGVQLIQVNGQLLIYGQSTVVTQNSFYAGGATPMVLSTGNSLTISNGAKLFIFQATAGSMPSSSSSTQTLVGLPNMVYLTKTGGTYSVGQQAGGTGGGSFDYLYATNAAISLTGLLVGNANGSNNLYYQYGGTLTNYILQVGTAGTYYQSNAMVNTYGGMTGLFNNVYIGYAISQNGTQFAANVSISDTGTLWTTTSNSAVYIGYTGLINGTNSYAIQNQLNITNGGSLVTSNLYVGLAFGGGTSFSNFLNVIASSLYITNANASGNLFLGSNAASSFLTISNGSIVKCDNLLSYPGMQFWYTNMEGNLSTTTNNVMFVSNSICYPTNIITICDPNTVVTVNNTITNDHLGSIIVSNGAWLNSSNYCTGGLWTWYTNSYLAGGNNSGTITYNIGTNIMSNCWSSAILNNSTWSNTAWIKNGTNANLGKQPSIVLSNASTIYSGCGISNYGNLFFCTCGSALISTGTAYNSSAAVLTFGVNAATPTNSYLTAASIVMSGGTVTFNVIGTPSVLVTSTVFSVAPTGTYSTNVPSLWIWNGTQLIYTGTVASASTVSYSLQPQKGLQPQSGLQPQE